MKFSLSFSFLLTFTLLLASLSIGQGQETPGEDQLAKWHAQFPDADLNGDGRLTVEEATRYREQLQEKRPKKIPPTHADAVYGNHERNRFDLWLPEKRTDGRPIPVLVYFHGGGFVAGDKGGVDPSIWLANGIAFVSANYRFVNGSDTFADTPLLDGARVVQTLRERATEWGLDRGRIALTGSSAGAVISMWIAYHNDLANPNSDDPVSRQSTRVTCLVPFDGPTNLLPEWILSHIGGSPVIHESFAPMFGSPATEPLTPDVLARITEASPWEHASADDPPTLFVYTGPLDAVPLPPGTSTGKVIHHPVFEKLLKEKLDALGVECDFKAGFTHQGGDHIMNFLKNHFAMTD